MSIVNQKTPLGKTDQSDYCQNPLRTTPARSPLVLSRLIVTIGSVAEHTLPLEPLFEGYPDYPEPSVPASRSRGPYFTTNSMPFSNTFSKEYLSLGYDEDSPSLICDVYPGSSKSVENFPLSPSIEDDLCQAYTFSNRETSSSFPPKDLNNHVGQPIQPHEGGTISKYLRGIDLVDPPDIGGCGAGPVELNYFPYEPCPFVATQLNIFSRINNSTESKEIVAISKPAEARSMTMPSFTIPSNWFDTDQAEVESGPGSSSWSDSELNFELNDLVPYSMISEIAQLLLQKYLKRSGAGPGSAPRQYNIQNHQSGSIDYNNNDTSNSAELSHQNVRAASSQGACGGPSRKRKRDEDNGNEDNDRRKSGVPASDMPSEPNENTQLWACPFYKKNRHRHRSCGRSILKTIPRVKYHLLRYHQPPIHCERCSLTFSNEYERLEHTRMVASCLVKDPIVWDAVNKTQKEQLSKKISSKNTPRQNWYRIFDLLFPGTSSPDSPYLEGLESQELRCILKFAETESAGIVGEILASSQEPSTITPEDLPLYLTSITQEFVNLLFERWETIGRTSNDSSSSRWQPAIDTPAVQSQQSDVQGSQSFTPPITIGLSPASLENSMEWPQTPQNSGFLVPPGVDAGFSFGALDGHRGSYMFNQDEWLALDDMELPCSSSGIFDKEKALNS